MSCHSDCQPMAKARIHTAHGLHVTTAQQMPLGCCLSCTAESARQRAHHWEDRTCKHRVANRVGCVNKGWSV
jgi:hypothetical protein